MNHPAGLQQIYRPDVIAGGMARRGYIDGLITGPNADDVDHDVDIGPGELEVLEVGGTDHRIVQHAGTITKQLDATFAEGTDAGGLDTGSVAASTEYNVFAIWSEAKGADVLFSTGATPSLPTGFTHRRRIASVFTDSSSDILPYQQFGDLFWREATTLFSDSSGTPDTFETATLDAPPNSLVFIAVGATVGGATRGAARLRLPGATMAANAVDVLDNADSTTRRLFAGFPHPIDDNAQIEYTINTDGSWLNFFIRVFGWLDHRGRDGF